MVSMGRGLIGVGEEVTGVMFISCGGGRVK